MVSILFHLVRIYSFYTPAIKTRNGSLPELHGVDFLHFFLLFKWDWMGKKNPTAFVRIHIGAILALEKCPWETPLAAPTVVKTEACIAAFAESRGDPWSCIEQPGLSWDM